MKKIITYFIIGLLMILSATALTFNATQTLNYTYPFDSNTSDTFKNVASITQGNTYIVSGCKIGSCAAFDGVDDGLNTTQILLPATANFTILGWVYTNGTSTTQSVVTQYTASTAGRWEFQSRYEAAALGYPSRISYEATNITFGDRMETSAWHCFAITRNSSGYTIWDNGQANSTASNNSAILQTQTWFGIASDLARDFKGRLDEVAGWDSALSASHISELCSGSGTSIATIISSGLPPITDYYFAKNGSDSNDCSEPYPCMTIVKANTLDHTGKNIHFLNGDVWEEYYDDTLVTQDGTSSGYTKYSNYGNPSLPFPEINQFINVTSCSSAGSNLWSCLPTVGTDVGAIYMSNYSALTVKVNISNLPLTTQGQFYYRDSDGRVYIYSTSNPLTYYGKLRFVADYDIFDIDNKNWVQIENLSIRGTGAHGIIGSSVSDLIIRNNTIAYIGGSYHGTGHTNRYGNCIEVSQDVSNVLIEKNIVHDCQDAGLTLQGFDNTVVSSEVNVTFSHNLVWNTLYWFEYFNSGNGATKTWNITVEGNTGIDMGNADLSSQKGFPRMRMESTPVNTLDFEIYDNIIGISDYKLVQLGAHPTTWDAPTKPYYHNNGYIRESTTIPILPFTLNGSEMNFTAWRALGIDTGSNLFNNTNDFVGYSTDDFRPVDISLLCTMGTTGSYVGYYPCASNQPPTISNIEPINNTVFDFTTTFITLNATANDMDLDVTTLNFINNTNGAILCSNYTASGSIAKCLINIQLGEGLSWNLTINDSINPIVYYGTYHINISLCNNVYANSSPTAWNNMGLCSITDVQVQNRSYNIYDSNMCGNFTNTTVWEYQNISCTLCGDNNAIGTEECDGTDLQGQSCYTFGYNNGILSCLPSCTFDLSNCENVNVYVDSLYNASSAANSDNIAGFISNTNNGVGQVFVSAFVMAFFFIFIMALKRYPIEDVIPSVSFVFFIASIFMRQASLISFYLVELFFFILAASVAYRFIRGE